MLSNLSCSARDPGHPPGDQVCSRAPGAPTKKVDASSLFFLVPLGGLEEQPSEGWENATAANTSSEEASKGNDRPSQAFGAFFFFFFPHFSCGKFHII